MSGLDVTPLEKINSLEQFDDYYTGPLHGYESAMDYYQRCSAIGFLKTIAVPTLIVNAKNDPFLSKACFPQNADNPFIKWAVPLRGGHVGFSRFRKNGLYWSEQMALEFIGALKK